MQDPSVGVQPPLKGHLHLISTHNYPLVAQLNMDQAFRYLMEAPAVVKQVAPMSWQYLTPPPDGTIFLEWLSPAQNGGRFPSDGYAYGDPEQTYRQSINGYTMELLVHNMGFRPGYDHMTSHARTRYHFISKAPHINAASPDPSLWIVHYHQTPQQRIVPTQQVPIDPHTRGILAERTWLENQGRIERRDFMLHDREHWPTITLPGMQPQQMREQGLYSNNVQNRSIATGQNRYMQPPFPQPAGPPSAKRQRVQGPGANAVAEAPIQDFGVEEEDNIAHGDYFDHLSPRDISLTRYQQHHRWMGEVFSSPYSIVNIVPADLGLGLMGELKGLTEGILPPPTTDIFLEKKPNDSGEPVEAAAFTNLSTDQLDEFNARVQKHIEEGKSEIERMKADHAVKMREWRKTHKLTQAERLLRGATWKGHEAALNRAGDADATQQVLVEEVVDTVEQLVGRKVKAHSDAALIEKGGLTEIESRAADTGLAVHSQQQSKAPSVSPSEPISFRQDHAPHERANSGGQQASITSAAGQPNATQPTPAIDGGPDTALQQASEAVPRDSVDADLLNDDMDLDAADLQFDSGDTPGQIDQVGPANTHASAQVDTSAQASLEKDNITPADIASSANPVAAATNAVNDTGAAQQSGDTNMFTGSNFDFADELGADGDGVGDGLIDFGDEDAMGMDDSAFGDALHGMDD